MEVLIVEKNDIKFTTEIKVNGELFIKAKLDLKSIKNLERIIDKLEKGEIIR